MSPTATAGFSRPSTRLIVFGSLWLASLPYVGSPFALALSAAAALTVVSCERGLARRGRRFSLSAPGGRFLLLSAAYVVAAAISVFYVALRVAVATKAD